MKTLLMGKGLWEIVENGYVELDDWSSLGGKERRIKKEEHLNYLALLNIRKSMKKNVFPLVAGCRIAWEAWKKLQVCFGGDKTT